MKKIAIVLAILSSWGALHSQKLPHPLNKYDKSILFVPQYNIVNGLKFSYDHKIDSLKWLTFGPQLYVRAENGGDFEELVGIGIDCHIKNKTLMKHSPVAFYLAYGGTAILNYVTYTEETWRTASLLGSEVQLPHTADLSQTILKVGPDIYFGLEYMPVDRFLLEFYFGSALRYSIFSEDYKEPFQDDIIDVGYSGVLPIAGFKFGMTLK